MLLIVPCTIQLLSVIIIFIFYFVFHQLRLYIFTCDFHEENTSDAAVKSLFVLVYLLNPSGVNLMQSWNLENGLEYYFL
jgi:hypothetical protein